MDEGEFDHRAEVDSGLFKSGWDSPGFLEPADEACDEPSTAIRFFVERHRASNAIFVCFAGNHRRDTELLQQVLVNPSGVASLAAGEVHRPGGCRVQPAAHSAGVGAPVLCCQSAVAVDVQHRAGWSRRMQRAVRHLCEPQRRRGDGGCRARAGRFHRAAKAGRSVVCGRR